jgi:alpha-tubulin suppressor-like RCC1 family protein
MLMPFNKGHLVLVDQEGYVYACGTNDKGQLGLGDTEYRQTFVQLSLTKIKSLAVGKHHNIAVAEDGSLWSWGIIKTEHLIKKFEGIVY